MTWFHRYKNSMTCRADFIVRDQFAFDNHACAGRFLYTSNESDGAIGRRGPKQFYRILGGDSTRRFVSAGFLHQVPGCGPIAVTIEQRTDDSTAQHACKRFVLAAGLPLRHDLLAVGETADLQSLRVGRTTTKTAKVRSVSLLNTLCHTKRPIVVLQCWNALFALALTCTLRSGSAAGCEAALRPAVTL